MKDLIDNINDTTTENQNNIDTSEETANEESVSETENETSINEAEETLPPEEDEIPEEFNFENDEITPEKEHHENKLNIFLKNLKENMPKAKTSEKFAPSDGFLDVAIRIMIGFICLAVSFISSMPAALQIILRLVAIAMCGVVVFKNAVIDIKNKRLITENTITSVASIASFICSYYADSVLLLFVMEMSVYVKDALSEKINEKIYSEALTQDNSDHMIEKISRLVKESETLEGKFSDGCKIYSYAVIVVGTLIFAASLIFRNDWVHRALTLIVAALPIPVYSAISVAYTAGIAGATKNNIIFKNCRAVKETSSLTSVIFDMTGTLCSDNYTISNIYPIRISDEQLLYLAACAEEFSNHPLAKAIKEASTIPVDRNRIIKHHEEQGVGCIAQLDTLDIISIGNLELMERLGINGDLIPCDCTVVYVAIGKTYVGRIELYGQINNGAERTVTELKKSGVSNVAMITGDNTLTATAVGRAVGISEIYADCLPKDKFDRVKYILDTQEKDDKLAFVCRSNGNIRAMELANVSITLDGNGENAMSPDIAIIGKDITNVSKAVKISKKIVGIIKENLILSALCEVAVIALTLTGIINMWFSALVNLILSVAVMMNSARFKNIPWRSKTKEID